MLQPKKISLANLSFALKDAVLDIDGVEGDELAFVQNPAIIGFVAPIESLSGKSLAEISGIAQGVKIAAGDLAGPSHILIQDGHVTIGFVLNQEQIVTGTIA
ncbi:hypothetical protein BH10PSE12_BH10PSE12_35640 [soil metagenome]